MEQLNIAICEDNSAELEHLLAILAASAFPTKITPFSCGEDLLLNYQAGSYDLILMDIYMGGITGVETISRLRQLDTDVIVAFTTSSTDHALEGYRLDALKYLEKPIQAQALLALLELVRLKKNNLPSLRLQIHGKAAAIPFREIVYLEQRSHHLLVYLTGGRQLQAVEQLNKIEAQFPKDDFFRCHKSFLVNLSKVKNLDRELMVFTMEDGHNVHIRRGSLPAARKAFEGFLAAQAAGIDPA